jgi:hypothetical protein
MPDGIFPFSIQFSQNFTQSAKAGAVLSLRLEAFFPGTLLAPALRTARWLSDSSLYLEWEGVSPSEAGEPHWYRLVLPGGRSGIANGSGSYLKEDAIFVKEAVE